MDPLIAFESACKSARSVWRYGLAVRQSFLDALEPTDVLARGEAWRLAEATAADMFADTEAEEEVADAWVECDYTPRKWSASKCGKCGDDMILRHVCTAPASPVAAEPAPSRPPGFYTMMHTQFATEHYGFPSDPWTGYQQTASDGSIWVFNNLGTGEWDCTNYPPTGDPYQAVKALEDARWCGEHGTTWGSCKHEPHGITPDWTDPPAAADNSDGAACYGCGRYFIHAPDCPGDRHPASPVGAPTAGDSPAEVSAETPDPAPSAGHPSELVLALPDELLDVLAEHLPSRDYTGIYCNGNSLDGPHAFCHDWQAWREHVSGNVTNGAAADERIDASLHASGFRKTTDIAADVYPQHQRYEPCVTDSAGRCTRFSHDHK